MSAPASWYLGRAGQKLGPYPAPELQRMAASGQVLRADMLLAEGSSAWVSAGSLAWLFPPHSAAFTVGSKAPPLSPSTPAAAPAPYQPNLAAPPPQQSYALWWVLGGVLVSLFLLCGGALVALTLIGKRANQTFTVVGNSLSASGGGGSPALDPPPADQDPLKQIRNYIRDDYKKKGTGYEIVAMNPPKKVQSKLGAREFVIARVQHKAMSDNDVDPPLRDQVFVIEYLPRSTVKMLVIKFEDWDQQKVQFGIEEQP